MKKIIVYALASMMMIVGSTGFAKGKPKAAPAASASVKTSPVKLASPSPAKRRL